MKRSKNEKHLKLGLFLMSIAVCIFLTIYFNIFLGKDIIYTHAFYIPIILAGIYFYRKAIYVAIFLGVFHIISNYIVHSAILTDSVFRAFMFILIAWIISALAKKKDKLISVIKCFPDATFAIDNHGKVIAWNKAMENLTGINAESILGKGDLAYSLPFYGTKKKMLIDLILDKKEHIKDLSEETHCPTLGPKGAFISFQASTLFDIFNNPIGAICSVHDITDSKNAQQEVKYLSLHDKLTGLYNRAYFEEELLRYDIKKDIFPLSVLIGDINGLRLANDAFGYCAGDKIMIKVAQIIKKVAREEDVTARWGGDEFIILLPNTDKKEVSNIAIRIKEESRELKDMNLPFQIDISIGISTKSNASENLITVIKEAEDNMYRNKLLVNTSTRSSLIISMGKALQAKSHETEEHTQRIVKYLTQFGLEIGLSASEIDCLKLLGVLHDIGKIGIPDSILNKPLTLTEKEWEIMKRHSEIGYRIVSNSPELTSIAYSVLTHHERWDGKGYPLGLKGDEIPLYARMLSLADAYDVMTNGRAYKLPMSSEEALEEIGENLGSQFDPELGKKFIKLENITINRADPLRIS